MNERESSSPGEVTAALSIRGKKMNKPITVRDLMITRSPSDPVYPSPGEAGS